MAVDDLFSGTPEGEAPLPNPLPRLRLLLGLTTGLVIAGPCCCTGPLGAVLALWVWARAGDAMARIESGLHPSVLHGGAQTVRQAAFGMMVLSCLSLCAQSVAWSYGIYEGVAMFVVQTVAGWIGG